MSQFKAEVLNKLFDKTLRVGRAQAAHALGQAAKLATSQGAKQGMLIARRRMVAPSSIGVTRATAIKMVRGLKAADAIMRDEHREPLMKTTAKMTAAPLLVRHTEEKFKIEEKKKAAVQSKKTAQEIRHKREHAEEKRGEKTGEHRKEKETEAQKRKEDAEEREKEKHREASAKMYAQDRARESHAHAEKDGHEARSHSASERAAPKAPSPPQKVIDMPIG